jgi:hypothetical protein
LHANNVEEVKINFAAFINSARGVTFVLNTEFNKDPTFMIASGKTHGFNRGMKSSFFLLLTTDCITILI